MKKLIVFICFAMFTVASASAQTEAKEDTSVEVKQEVKDVDGTEGSVAKAKSKSCCASKAKGKSCAGAKAEAKGAEKAGKACCAAKAKEGKACCAKKAEAKEPDAPRAPEEL